MITFVDPWTTPGPLSLVDPGAGPPARRHRQRSLLVVPMAVAALVLALFGPTAPSFLSWGSSATTSGTEAPVASGSSPGAEGVASQVDHLLIADATAPGVLTVTD